VGILQGQQSKTFEVTKKKIPDHVKYWSKIHQDTNWNDVSCYIKHGKKLSRLNFRMVGTGEPKETCGRWVTEGCDNSLNDLIIQIESITVNHSNYPAIATFCFPYLF